MVGLVGLEPMTSTMSSHAETIENTAFASLLRVIQVVGRTIIFVLFLYWFRLFIDSWYWLFNLTSIPVICNRLNFIYMVPTFHYNFRIFCYLVEALCDNNEANAYTMCRFISENYILRSGPQQWSSAFYFWKNTKNVKEIKAISWFFLHTPTVYALIFMAIFTHLPLLCRNQWITHKLSLRFRHLNLYLWKARKHSNFKVLRAFYAFCVYLCKLHCMRMCV